MSEYLDYDDPELPDENFVGIAWVPTTRLRWVVDAHPDGIPQPWRLQQLWETRILVRGADLLSRPVPNPGLTQWRDVPVFELPGGNDGDTADNSGMRPG